MKENTAMQQMKADIQSVLSHFIENSDYSQGYKDALDMVIKNIEKKWLPEERKHIEEAYCADRILNFPVLPKDLEQFASDYFTQKYIS